MERHQPYLRADILVSSRGMGRLPTFNKVGSARVALQCPCVTRQPEIGHSLQ